MLVADGGLEPVAVVLDVDDGEAGDLGRPAARPGVIVVRPSSSAVSGPRKRRACRLDGDRAAGAVGERRGELVADGGAALGPLALLVDDEGVLREGRGGGRGVARVERLRERRDQRGDGLGVVGLSCRLAGRRGRPLPGLPSRIPGLPSPGKSRVPPRRTRWRPVSFLSLLGEFRGERLAVLSRWTERFSLSTRGRRCELGSCVFSSDRDPCGRRRVYAYSDTAGETNEPPPRTASTAGIKSMAAVRLSTNPATPALRICVATVGSS